MKAYEFDATIKTADIGSGGAYVEFPYDVEKEFGVKGRVMVVCLFDGVEYAGSLVRMGTECHIIGITKEIRNKIGKNPGDAVHVRLYKDESERTVTVHPLLAEEFKKNPGMKGKYEKLSFTKRKEILTLLEGAKKEETLKNRLNKILLQLK